jgi:hypothetical protein
MFWQEHVFFGKRLQARNFKSGISAILSPNVELRLAGATDRLGQNLA